MVADLTRTFRVPGAAMSAGQSRMANKLPRIDVGQVDNLRGGWIPPPAGANTGGTLWVRPIANRPQLTKLPHTAGEESPKGDR
jgi:hypothetical protein